MRGRPLLITSYADDQALLPTTTKKVATTLFLIFLVCIPLFAPGALGAGEGRIPGPSFLAGADWLKLLTELGIFAIAALGLNILMGLAGQVSLGHAFFMGLGAYTAAIFGAEPGALWGMGLPIWIWLPLAGLIPAVVGILVAPTAVRVRGLYLAVVTLGLVFIGEYLWRNLDFITGGSQSGRAFPGVEFRLWREDEAFFNLDTAGTWFGFVNLSGEAKFYFFVLVLLILGSVVAKNIERTRVGRAFQAIRDRDVAAEIMGVDEFRYKTLAFAISSFYAGVAGALLAIEVGRTIPEQWDLVLSVEIVAIVLIGGVGTVTGVLLGSAFVVLLPRLVQDFANLLADSAERGGILGTIFDPILVTEAGDFGLINLAPGVAPGLGILQLNTLIYGLLIVLFLIFEPLGLYGIWVRIRNYWKSWPFTY